MRLQVDNLGKVAITVESEPWDINRSYERLTVVPVPHEYSTYISRKRVPINVEITNRDYWIPFSPLNEKFLIDFDEIKKRYDKLQEDLKELKENFTGSSDKQFGESFNIINNKIEVNAITEEELNAILI